jgi:hypothetical protein
VSENASSRTIAGLFVGEIPEHLRPPAPGDLVHPPFYPWRSAWQLRKFVDRVFDEVMEEFTRPKSENDSRLEE